MKINPEKIRDVIGKGGAVIRALTEETGTQINIDEDGTITIASTDPAKAEEAKKRIEQITAEVEIGKVYEGPITKILDFGALVNLLPGKDGLLHISQIAHERVEKVTDYLSEGQIVQGQGARDRRKGPRQAVHEGPARASGRHEFQERPPREPRERPRETAWRSSRARGDRSRATSAHRVDRDERAAAAARRSSCPQQRPGRRPGLIACVDSCRIRPRAAPARRPSKTMKAIEISAYRPARACCAWASAPRPSPGAGELLIRVTASGINRPDVLQRTGNYPVPPGASDIPGLEVAGEIVDGDAQAHGRRPASSRATASARWSPAAATPSCAWRRSASACRCPRA